MADLSWDTFPAPTPEAEEWQPDPDSVPVAGALPDPRFNKDPLTVQQKQALKRDKRLGLFLDGPSESTAVPSFTSSVSKTGTITGIGSWPVAAPRATGYPRALTPSVQHPLFSSSEPLKIAETAAAAPAKTPASTPKTATPSQPTNISKGTMETLPVRPLFQRPHTPPMSVASQASESPPKTHTPAWARVLEHLLGDSPPRKAPLRKAPPQLAPLSQPPSAQAPAPASSVSRPPHLRKQTQSFSSTAAPIATLGHCLDSVEGTDAQRVKAQPTTLSATPSLDLLRHTQDNSAATRLEPTSVVEVGTASFITVHVSGNTAQELKVQKSLLESFIPKKTAASSEEHERYLKARLIGFMEDELDMSSRTTRRQLNDLSEKEFEAYFTKTKSVHKVKWEIKQKRDKIGEMDVKTTLVTFQQKEGEQFKLTNSSTGACF